MTDDKNLPIACTLSSTDQARATAAYKAGLFKHATELRGRDDGVSLRFDWSKERVLEVGEFLAVDTSCCAFLDHRLEVPRGKESIWLHLTGPEDAQQLLVSEIRSLVPAKLASWSAAPPRDTPAGSKTWIARAGLGFTGLGLLSVACCVAPMLGIGALATGGAVGLGMLIDPVAGLSLALGVGLLAWWRRSRSKPDCGSGC